MENERNITPLTDLDETVEQLLPHPRLTTSFYLFLLAATLLLSVLSVFYLI